MSTLTKFQVFKNDLVVEDPSDKPLHERLAISKTNLDGIITYVNDTFCKECGYSADELIGQTHKKLSSYVHPESFFDGMWQCVKSGQVWQGEICNRHKNGTLYWSNVSYYPIFDTEGVVNGNIAIRFKVTKEQQIILTQKLKAQQYDSIISGVAGFWHLDEIGRFIDINDQYCFASGYTREDLIHATVLDLEAFGFEGEFMEVFNSLQIEQPQYFETKHKRQDGSTWDVRIMLIRQLNQSVHAFTWDVSARKQEEYEKKLLLKEVYYLQKMESLGRLTSGIANDFNNLLMAISGCNELNKYSADDVLDQNISRETIRAQFLENSKQIDMTITRTKDLIDKLLVYCQREPVESEDPVLNINQSLESVIEFLRKSFPSTITFELNLLATNLLNATLNIDNTELHQIMMNICLNSRDAFKLKPGKISIKTDLIERLDSITCQKCPLVTDIELVEFHCNSCKKSLNTTDMSGKFIEIKVSDNGCGIDSHILPRIFDPFFTTKSVGEGTGLGLSTVCGMVDRASGHIIVSSQLGKGTEVKLFFPI
jgi:PAS domain S-box-containing protein